MNCFVKSTHRLYFSYGSNMNPEQMKSRCATNEVIAVARLADHGLGFFGYSGIWDGGQAAVTRSPGEELWGVVYKLPLAGADNLDSWQDVRLDGTGQYFLYPTDVVDTNGLTHQVRMYKKDIHGEPVSPSEGYLNYIVAGASFHHLPASYIEKLKHIPTKKASFPVPKKTGYDPSVFSFSCDMCESDED